MKRFGMVNYSHEDYEPAVGDPDATLISLVEYAKSEAGKADVDLETMRNLWRVAHGKPAKILREL